MSVSEPQRPKKFRFFRARAWGCYALILANVAIYVACAEGTEHFTPDPRTLLRAGAVTASTVTDGQYWRLLAAGFLHANPAHLITNMLCLALWGRPLEKRIGILYFTLIYFSSLLAGSLVTVFAHQTPFIGVGASGAISGVLAALLVLCLLGKIEVSLTYIVQNIAINVFASAAPGVDWRAHFGGFCAGLLGGATFQRRVKRLPSSPSQAKLEYTGVWPKVKSTFIWTLISIVMLLLLAAILLLSR
jgi:membrane associated rhomboid family serine protease